MSATFQDDPRRHVAFSSNSPLFKDLKQATDEYFASTGLGKNATPLMVRKTVIIFAWFALSYGLYLASSGDWWQLLPIAFSLGLAMAGIGFSIMHDGNHESYAKDRKLSRNIGFALDLLGGSSYFWRQKHNVLHHTYPNLDGLDDDIGLVPLMRMAPTQPRLWAHRFQHVYMFALYGLISPKWFFVDDWRTLANGRIGQATIPRPKGFELFMLVAGKLFHFTWMFVLPTLVHGLATTLLFYLVTSVVLGVTLAVVFQLAHCVEEAAFFEVPANGVLEGDFAAHQLTTTVDFARNSPFVTWYLGGLNYQAIHHLFPRICHVHYPALSKIVETVCARHGVPYLVTPTLSQSIGSHYRWMRRMGRPEEQAEESATLAAA